MLAEQGQADVPDRARKYNPSTSSYPSVLAILRLSPGPDWLFDEMWDGGSSNPMPHSASTKVHDDLDHNNTVG